MNYKLFKRVVDILLSAGMLLVLSPLLLFIIIVCVFVHGRSNIFFLQERVGLYGKIFRVIKFKTMTDDKDQYGNLLPDKDRETSWGHFLRRSSMDELLQLINVIKGDMSLIGPRPLIEKQIIYASGRQLCRFDTRPGISGLAQIRGRNNLHFEHRFRYDEWYVKNLGARLDFYIMISTIKVIVSGHGTEYNPEVVEITEMKRDILS